VIGKNFKLLGGDAAFSTFIDKRFAVIPLLFGDGRECSDACKYNRYTKSPAGDWVDISHN